MNALREPAVAGMFYPAEAPALREMVDAFLRPPESGPPPKMLIVPHAGYDYSGAVAGAAYSRLQPIRGVVSRVVLFGPSHCMPFYGIAAPESDAFATPLGPVPVDRAALERLRDLPFVRAMDRAHEQEHGLEVQLPFLQRVLDTFSIVPLIVGDAEPEDVAAVMDRLWGGPETLMIISSDLSHYHDYETACRLDGETSDAIEQFRPEAIGQDRACGRIPVQAALLAARARRMKAERLELRNSGDAGGPRDRVVGYGAYVVH